MKLRKATLQDSPLLWFWRNDTITRMMSKDSRIIPWNEHNSWFRSHIEPQHSLILIGEVNDEAIGTVRFDHNQPNEAHISINIARHHRNKGYGTQLLQEVCQFAREPLGLHTLSAEIKVDNATSLHCFQNANFQKTNECDGIMSLHLSFITPYTNSKN